MNSITDIAYNEEDFFIVFFLLSITLSCLAVLVELFRSIALRSSIPAAFRDADRKPENEDESSLERRD
jgi:hypothetical protein